MSDKSVKPDLMVKFYDKGEQLAHQAEGGLLTEVIKELDTLKKQLGKGEYNALMMNIKNVNTADVAQDQIDVAAGNKKNWFGIGDKKPALPTLIFDDPEKDGIPNKLVGYFMADGSLKTAGGDANQKQPAAGEKTHANPAAKANNGDNVLMLNPNSEAAADLVWKQMMKK